MVEFDEILNSPGFWLLGGGAVTATVLGYIASKRMDLMPLPLWQLGIIILAELIAAAYFATKD
jgi:hypothetical protein